jgi:hypothetical protein
MDLSRLVERVPQALLTPENTALNQEITGALSDYLDDHFSMYHASEVFIGGDVSYATYTPQIANLSARRKASRQALKVCFTAHNPTLTFSPWLGAIVSHLLQPPHH